MYYYLSFLRPPPTSIDLASSSAPGVTITPQIANDLRTELLDDRPTRVYYTWSSHPATHLSLPNTAPPRRCSGFLTTYLPPTSTYKPNHVPLPRGCKAGEVWYLGLSANVDEDGRSSGNGGEEMTDLVGSGTSWRAGIPLEKGRIVDVWSQGIRITSSSSSSSSSSTVSVQGKSKPSSKKTSSSKHFKTSSSTGNADPSSKSPRGEGPKQTRIVRAWSLPQLSRTSLNEEHAEKPGSDFLRPEREAEAGPSRALKRDSEGLLKVPKRDEVDSVSSEVDVQEEDHAVEVQQERILSIVEETSFDLDKKIWDSGLALTSYLTQLPSSCPLPTPLDLLERLQCPRARILEIGAGTGLVGIGLAASGLSSGARVMITDLPSAIPLIDENIELNRSLWHPTRAEQQDGGVQVRSGVLDWDDEIPDWVWEWDGAKDAKSPLDVIVAADVTYNTDSFPALISTLSRLFTPITSSTSTPLLLLAYKQRHAAERTLWPALEEIGIGLTKFGTIMGHEEDLGVDVVTGRDEDEGEEVRSGMGGTELWIGRKKTS